MNDRKRDSVSELLLELFREFHQEGISNSLLRLSNRLMSSFANSVIPDERDVISSIKGIAQQKIMDGNTDTEKLHRVYNRLLESKQTNPQTRSWMLYLLLSLHYQNKSISLSSFNVPALQFNVTSTVFPVIIYKWKTPVKIISQQESTLYSESSTNVPVSHPISSSQTMQIAEPLLIRDIISSFQGIDTHYFHYDDESTLYVVSVDLQLPPHIYNTVLRLLQIGSLYRRIRSMMDQTKSEEHGIIRNSVNDNVNNQLYQFYRFVISLEETNNASIKAGNIANPFSLQKLSFFSHNITSSVFQCESPLQRLTYLYNILCCSINLRGGALASSIYNFTNHGNSDYRNLSSSLLGDINRFMLKQSWEWAVNGRLLDIHAEFFVEIAIPSFTRRIDGQDDSEYNKWMETYHFRHRMIPSFFPKRLVDQIFNSGKSIHFIRDALQDHKWAVRGADVSVLESCTLEDYLPLETLLTSVYEQAQDHIISFYKDRYCLLQTVKLFQQFYLLGAGDFYLEFISRVDYGFLHNRAEVSDGWLQEEFNKCVNRTSLCSQFAFISEHVRLNRLRALSSLDMWRSPFFIIEQEQNLSVIFSKTVMMKYDQIFVTLMALKIQSFEMERMWMDQCVFSKEMDRIKDECVIAVVKPVMDIYNLLRVKIHSFLTTLQNFYFLHIIDKLYNNIMTKLQSIQQFDELLSLHEMYINDLCKYFFVDNGELTIKNNINELLECSKKFIGFQNQLYDSISMLVDKYSKGESVTVELSNIEQNKNHGILELNVEFTTKLQQLIIKLRNPPKGYSDYVTIASQLDFNYYYTEC